MKPLAHLLFKIILFAMIITAPAMIAGNSKSANFGVKIAVDAVNIPYYSSAVIKRFIHYKPAATPLYNEDTRAGYAVSAVSVNVVSVNVLSVTGTTAPLAKATLLANAAVPSNTTAPSRAAILSSTAATAALSTKAAVLASIAAKATPLALELKTVIHEAVSLYDSMNLAHSDLGQEAFEYAWRGYHNLVKKGLLHKTSVLSICDFSQSSRNKRLYVIDVRHKKLLYRTYVAHGANSGTEFANSFSNAPESGKSSLGFYVTGKTYIGRNGLSLKIKGVDEGYNDQAAKRNIVLHGSTYICPDYLRNCGEMGTSLGCPAIPAAVSPGIIRLVKHGSCLFIYHPNKKYLSESRVINQWSVRSSSDGHKNG